jgi:hypothetical protein
MFDRRRVSGGVGLAEAMTIKIADGKHFYELDYTLPEAS